MFLSIRLKTISLTSNLFKFQGDWSLDSVPSNGFLLVKNVLEVNWNSTSISHRFYSSSCTAYNEWGCIQSDEKLDGNLDSYDMSSGVTDKATVIETI